MTYYNGYNYAFVWEGRDLISATVGNKTYTMTYNDEGQRTSKTVNGVTTYYYYDGDLLISETTGDVVVVYHYDAVGSPIGFQYRDGSYSRDDWDVFWYQKNLQGDIIAIYDNTGTRKTTYSYTAWGHTIYGRSLPIDFDNPFTYRGYYYDHDLHLYYLNSRYYDSTNCRFINADSALYHQMLGYNMFAYCYNDPVNYVDYSGESGENILKWWCSIASIIASIEPTFIGEIVWWVGAAVIAIGVVLYAEEQLDDAIIVPPQSLPDTEDEVPELEYPGDDPTVAPDGYVWRGKGPRGSREGNYYNPDADASLHPDLDHPEPIGPHWDYNGPEGKFRIYPDGRIAPK